jgi:hypothetical protein
MENFKHLFETYDEGDGSEILLEKIYLGLVDTQNLHNICDCNESIDVLDVMQGALNTADVGYQTKSTWLSKIETARRKLCCYKTFLV